MKINTFTYVDKTLEWKINEISFDRLTLLVGASGVGKTQILKALYALKHIANGQSMNGVGWSVDFETGDGQHYTWCAEFENKALSPFIDHDENESPKNKPSIINEKLLADGAEIFNRTETITLFQGVQTLKLSPQQSMIYILREEKLIKPVYEHFNKILFNDLSDTTQHHYIPKSYNLSKTEKELTSLRSIQESDVDIFIKLYLAFTSARPTFDSIKARFCEIFPQVEDLKVDPLAFGDEDVPVYLNDIPVIQMKEIGVAKWIHQDRFSSGMFRTLLHISETYLCAEGTVFLIDEFENSLGINCIDELTNDILQSSRKIQFIITSHHPYIINTIDFSSWKLVTRTSGVVNTSPISKFINGKSKHDKFMQLMQLKQYETGID